MDVDEVGPDTDVVQLDCPCCAYTGSFMVRTALDQEPDGTPSVVLSFDMLEDAE